jgi:beta-phosphoglucomutase-like phosphatase (HAD superfamily)
MMIDEEEVEGLIFDCDGTLVDTMPAYWSSWKRTCEHFHLDFNEKRWQQQLTQRY